MEQIFDIIIIGGGPIGLACGIEAKNAGYTYLILEKGALTNSIYNYPLNMTFFSTSERLEIGGVPFISHHYKPRRDEALEYYRRVALTQELTIRLYSLVTDIRKSQNLYKVVTENAIFISKKVIIATGFFDLPNKTGIEGEELAKVHHYYKEAHPFCKQKIAVIGAANSAVDVALETYRKGAEVTMIVRDEKISERVKYWVKPDIENRIAEGSIKAYFNSEIVKIEKDRILVKTPEETLWLENNFVLAMTGYTPDFTLLRKAGVELQNESYMRPIFNPSTMETNQPGIYLAGVICGGLETHKWFIENSRIHAQLIMQHIIQTQSYNLL